MLESWEIKFRPEAESIRRLAKEFAEKEIAPIADRIDRENKYPMDLSTSITHRVHLDEVNTGLRILEERIGNPIRVVVVK